MIPVVVLALFGGVIAILIEMLVVVSIARGMDKTYAPAVAAEPEDGASSASPTGSKPIGGKAVRAAVLGALQAHSGMGMLLDAASASGKSSGKSKERPDTAQTKKAARAFAIVGGAVALISGVVHLITSDDEPSAPPVPTEIAAGALHGTLLNAGRHSEIVLIVPGSGPTDRNGDNPMGMKAQTYKLLAEGLYSKGISTVRVDKRGMFGSAGAGDASAATIAVYADDYRAWIDAIRAETGAKCVWLLGHSEGALMVSAAAEGRKDVCGLILVSGMGRKMADVIRQQLQDNPANAPVLPDALHAISELEAGRKVDVTGMHPALLPLFRPQVQDYLISMFATDPVEVLRRARKKTLIVQGTTDLQTTVEDAKRLDSVPRTRLKLVRGVNHVLKEAPLDRAENIATYANPDLPVSDAVIEAIEDFVTDDDD